MYKIEPLQMYTEEDDAAALMNNFFVAQTRFDVMKQKPPDISRPEQSLNFPSTSPLEVESVPKS